MPTSDPDVARGEGARGERDPTPGAPLAGPAQLDDALLGRPGRPALDRSVGRRERLEHRGRVLLGAAQPAPAHEQRPQDGGALVAGERPHRGPCGPGRRVEHAAQLAVRARAGQLRVAEHERPEVGPARLGLGPEDLGERDRLRRRAEQQPVDVGRAAPDARARELEAEVAQRGRDRLAPRRGLGRRLAVERPQHPVLEQHDPVVEVGRAPVRLAARGAGRERQPGGPEEAHARRGQARMPALEVGPRDLGALVALAPAVAQPRDHPLPEVERAVVAVVEQVGDELLEARLVLVEPLLLRRQRLGEPRELLVGREVPVADDRGGRHLEVDGPEERRVQLGLLGRQLVGRGGGEPDDVDAGAELLQHRPDDVAPQGGQVMALVEHDGGDAGGPERVHPLAGTGREQVAEVQVAADGGLGRRAISRFSPATIRATSWLRRFAAAPVHVAASAATAATGSPVAFARSSAQRASAAARSASPGSSSRASAW